MNIKHIFIIVMGLSVAAFSATALGAFTNSQCDKRNNYCGYSIITTITVRNNTDAEVSILREPQQGGGGSVVKYISSGQQGALTFPTPVPDSRKDLTYVSKISVTVISKKGASSTPCTLLEQIDIWYYLVDYYKQYRPNSYSTQFTPNLMSGSGLYQCVITDNNSDQYWGKLNQLIRVW